MTSPTAKKNSRTRVDRAGRELVAASEGTEVPEESLAVVNDWRSFHAFPLNSITVVLKQKSRRIQDDALVVQRLKRVRSIISKLVLKPSMRLTQMQDIGGCRAVFDSIESVYRLKDSYLDNKGQYEIVHIDDYIRAPKPSGYRSLHLVLKYKSKKYPQYDNLLLEVQARTLTQHAWATAVETVGAVLGQALKSSEGEEAWLSYFQNASLALEYVEKPMFTTIIPDSLGGIARKLVALDKELQVSKKLNSYRDALRATENTALKKDGYFLLVLLPAQPELQIFYFAKKNADEAYREYERYERLLPMQPNDPQLPLFADLANYTGAQAVLVGAESFKSLRESYPNYYLDTEHFLDSIQNFMQRYRRAP
ncbi:RelA/SpoT domain-containing protein [Lysobacter niabensis]|uniref:RelA/SpoT domain-containing protein n=1 Tax=Agrilutibacter niabensis TaxID=380628 RepID=UPI00360E2AD0